MISPLAVIYNKHLSDR